MIGMAPLIALAMAGIAAPPAPVILDTDLGDDIDDTWALAALLASPEFDLKLITTAFGDTSKKTALVAKILQAIGRPDIPIGTGVKTNDKPIHQEAWLGDYALSSFPGKIREDGVQAMIEAIHASAAPITLCVIGPQTNIKAALERDPAIAKKARIVSMAGSVRIGYEGAPQPQAEWNVVADVAAARAVFAAPWEITYAPLDACGQIRLKGEPYRAVATSRSPLARTVIANYDLWANRKQHPEDSSSILFDTLAVYLLAEDRLCTMETVKLSIDDKGFTREDEKQGRPVRCAMKLNDPAAFGQWLVEKVTVPAVAK